LDGIGIESTILPVMLKERFFFVMLREHFFFVILKERKRLKNPEINC